MRRARGFRLLALMLAVAAAPWGAASSGSVAPGDPTLDGPIAVFGDASCTGDAGECGPFTTGPVAVLGDASCSGRDGCGWFGTGPAAGGRATCSATNGCGLFGAGPASVYGDVSCTAAEGCGSFGTGPISLFGNVSCSATVAGCGHFGTGPVSVWGDVSCSGTCGTGGQFVVDLPRRGTPGITVFGDATCGTELQRSRILSSQHRRDVQCASVREVLGLPRLSAPPQEQVRVSALTGTPVSTVLPLDAGAPYTLEVTGVYDFSPSSTVSKADAECSSQFNQAYEPHRFGGPSPDPLDLYVDGAPITWPPAPGTDTGNGCSREHRYVLDLVGQGRQLRFHIEDTNYTDNGGELIVNVYRQGF